jgi:hypothetical protein
MQFFENSAGSDGQTEKIGWQEREHGRALTMLENQWLGIVIINRESCVSYANRAAEGFLEMPPGSLPGMRILDLSPVSGTVSRYTTNGS